MSDFRGRIDLLAEQARDERREFDPPDEPPDDERAIEFARDGVGEVVAVYVEARTGEFAPLDSDEMAAMERAVNDWLALYARCHGREIDPDCTVREIAETVIETRDVVESARLLTGVPDSEAGVAWRSQGRSR